MIKSLLCLLFFPLLANGIEHTPFYTYPAERVDLLKKIPTKHSITEESLKKWDHLLSNYLDHQPFMSGRGIRIFAYLYAAQADFAFLSDSIEGEFSGSIDPVSLGIIRLFYPRFPKPRGMVTDKYSIVLGRMIVEKYKRGMQTENAAQKEMAGYFSIQRWGYSTPNFGRNILGWLPWHISPFVLRLTPAPPSLSNKAFWSKQMEAVLEANKNVTEEQRKIAVHWGDFFEKIGGGWIELANTYLFSRPIEMEKLLYVRHFLTSSIYDTLTVTFEAKYTYSILPPYLENKAITPLLPVFNYPSYPSAHATTSAMAAALLGHFFPENAAYWQDLAEQIGQSRIWAGMNYPIDVKVGESTGKKIFQHLIAK
ncbi:MAG: hypothetical protein S4CHLAM2_11870 [Chlamydiales bacterium]|nr:hypothetical protein [Chlamydiales bacterium]